ncbi:MAG: hypothetical protein J6K88_03825 [Oscillospiraceae bacterium]|nr:hypothetical protein [Oscillospiraceae bacterium]
MYKCVEQRIKSEENGEYRSYGIRVSRDKVIEDVSTDKNFVEALTEKLNRLKVDPIHIYDVLEDEL